MPKSEGNHLFYTAPNPRDFFKHIQRFLEAGFWYWDSQSNHFHFSKMVLSAMGIKYDEQGVAREDFFNAVHHDDQKILQKAFNKLLAGKTISGDLEFRVLRKGYWRWVRAKVAVAEYTPDGQVAIIIGKFFDIDSYKYSVQPVVLDKKWPAFSFFVFNADNGTFQWHNPKQNIFELKTDETFNLLDELKPITPSVELNQFAQGWQQFVKGFEYNFSFLFTFMGLERKARVCKVFATKSSTNKELIEGVFIDKTAMLEAEGVENPRLKYSSLLSLHQIIFIGFSSSTSVTFCNKFAEKSLGYKFSELADEPTLKKLFSAPETYKRFIEYLKSGTSKPFECPILTKDGSTKIISWSAIQGFDFLEQLTVLGRDVTHLRSIEIENEKLNRRIRSYQSVSEKLLKNLTADNIYFVIGEQIEKLFPKNICTVFSFDSKDNFISIEGIFGISQKMRESFLADLGWNPVGRRFQLQDDVIGRMKNLAPIKLDKSLHEIADGYISMSAAKIVERNFEVDELYFVGLASENELFGGILLFNSSSNSYFDAQLLHDFAILSSLAINKVHKESALNGMVQELKALNDRKLDLLTHVSHEIRTPLNAILGFSQLLVNSDLDDHVRKQYIDIINSRGKTLIRLVNDIIDFNKIEKGELTIVRSNVNINRLLKEIYQFYLNELLLYSKETIEMQLSIPEETDSLELFTDEGRLGQALENLIDNALKFTERGTIDFGYTLDNDSINFFVKDTGIGIDPKMQELIFEKYRQMDASKVQGSAGLGLRITKEIVTLLNGDINVESEVGVGTTFNIRIPFNDLLTKKSVDEDQLLLEGRKVDFKNKVILIVDDEEANCMILDELLTAWGATTLSAKNGKEAVDLVNSINQTIDLVLMDIRMPVMDGYAATMEIKQINPKIPIVAQTAYASDEDRLKAEAAGCDGYITKPIDMNLLSDILEHFLSS